VIFALIVISLPANSQASVFFFVNGLFSSARAADVTPATALNSQKIALLEPVLNIDPNPTKASSTLAVENNALVTEAGPVGGGAQAFNDSASSDQISLYTVRDGDTLPGIAKMFGVSVNTILWANDLKKGATIHKDQVLTILPVSGVKYTVKKGDTLGSIAKQFKGDVNEIAVFNNLEDGQSLSPGDELIIPNGEANSVTPTVSTSKAKTTGLIGSAGTSVNFNGGPVDSGALRRPIDGGVRTQGIHGHNAVDLGSPVGTPIHAAAGGVVLISKNNGGWNGGYGNYVVISHPNGVQTLYAHMKSTTVSVGEHVAQGETIGYIGMTGDTSGPHVHFEVRGGVNPF